MIVGIDTGSAHQGVAVLAPAPPGAPFPFALLASTRLPVDPADLAPAAAATWAIIEAYASASVVIEGGNPYGSGGRIVSAAAVALQHAARLGDRVLVRCQDAGRVVRTLTRQGWAFRVVPKHLRGVDAKGRPNVIRDTHVRAALALYLSPDDCARLASVDERDAAGAAIGVTLLEEDAAALTEKRSIRHERGPAKPRERGSGKRTPARKRSLAERMADSRKRAALRGDVPRKVKRCGKCGGAARGHLRGLPCPPLPSAATPRHPPAVAPASPAAGTYAGTASTRQRARPPDFPSTTSRTRPPGSPRRTGRPLMRRRMPSPSLRRSTGSPGAPPATWARAARRAAFSARSA